MVKPVSESVLPSTSSRARGPLQVQLQSVAVKKQFLQVRRTKKDILPADFGIIQKNKRPILITEQLTRQNRELLFKARSLGGGDGYKFVWSSNGQVLASKTPNSKVIRITDIEHVNCLIAELNQQSNSSRCG